MSEGIPAMWMRGGTSKGVFFLTDDLPSNQKLRHALLLQIMGSPDVRQIDGIGGGDPLTSKVAIVQSSKRPNVDVDYLFLQVSVDQPIVSDAQNCGNLLAGVGPFAIERGLVPAQTGETTVNIYMVNTGQIAKERVQTPGRRVSYQGEEKIDGVPGTAAPIFITFQDTAGSTCGALFPSGQHCDRINGIDVTLVDNGMPSVLIAANDLGVAGDELPLELEQNKQLKTHLESIRLAAGKIMGLKDVTASSIPKMVLVSSALNGGAIATRSFIPHHCHKSIGVLGAVSVATACLTQGTVAAHLANIATAATTKLLIEHPSGALHLIAHIEGENLKKAEVMRTAKKLMDGTVFF